MEFKRKRVRGQRKEFRRTWVSDSLYRIVWRKECYGVEVPARYQATVRTIIPNYGNSKTFEMWDFVSTRRLYKTKKAAEEDCEKHKRLWEKACNATGVRGVIDTFGKVPLGYPVWVKNHVSRKVYEVLTRPNTGKYRECDDLDDLTEISDCSAGTVEVTPATPIPVSCVADEDSSPATSNVEPVVEPVKVRKKRASKSTVKSSNPTKKKKRNTKGSIKREAKPSANSPKKKSKRSKS